MVAEFRRTLNNYLALSGTSFRALARAACVDTDKIHRICKQGAVPREPEVARRLSAATGGWVTEETLLHPDTIPEEGVDFPPPPGVLVSIPQLTLHVLDVAPLPRMQRYCARCKQIIEKELKKVWTDKTGRSIK